MARKMIKPKGAICTIHETFRYSELGEKGWKNRKVYIKFDKKPKKPRADVYAYMAGGLLELLARTVNFVPDAGCLEEFDYVCFKFVLVWDEKEIKPKRR